MEDNIIIIDGKPVCVMSGDIDEKTTGVAIHNSEDIENTLKLKPISKKDILEDTLYNINIGEINE